MRTVKPSGSRNFLTRQLSESPYPRFRVTTDESCTSVRQSVPHLVDKYVVSDNLHILRLVNGYAPHHDPKLIRAVTQLCQTSNEFFLLVRLVE